MLAHHPVTGQPIRILRTDTQLSYDARTLCWVRATFRPSTRWSRWTTFLSEPTAFPVLCGSVPDIVYVTEWTEAWRPLLKTLMATPSDLLLVTRQSIYTEMEKEGFSWSQTLLLEDCEDMYPFLAEPVRAEDPVEKVVISLAHILRFQRVAWAGRTTYPQTVRRQQDAWKVCCKEATVLEVPLDADAEAVVPACWLIQQYFKHPLPKRARELWTALERNCACPYVDRVLLLNETAGLEVPKSDKIQVEVLGARLTYADVLKTIQDRVPANTFVVFGNSDIWLDASLRALWSLRMRERRLFLSLLRWEDGVNGDAPVLFGPRADSQDTWIVAKETVDFEVTEEDFGFPFGKPGCDNAINVAMLRKKCVVANPAYTVKTYHLHASNVRNYNPQDILYKPVYMYLNPTAIQMYSVETQLGAYAKQDAVVESTWRASRLTLSFPRPFHSVQEEEVKTLCSMIRMREGSTEMWEVAGKNTWTPTPTSTTEGGDKLYTFRGPMFVSGTGLLSNFQSIFVGGSDAWKAGWETNTLHSLSPSVYIPSLIAIPFEESRWESFTEWVLYYLPKALRIREAAMADADSRIPEFLVPSDTHVSDFLHDCRWNIRHLTTVPYMRDVQYFSKSVWAVEPQASHRISREDVQRLRQLAPILISERQKYPVLVFCVDTKQAETAVCTSGWVEECRSCLESLLQGGNWSVEVVTTDAAPSVLRRAFQRAAWIVSDSAETLKWMWFARPRTTIVHFQQESSPLTSEMVHLAGACAHRYIPCLVRKEPIEYQREHAVIRLGRVLQTYGLQTVMDVQKAEDRPLVQVPTATATATAAATAAATATDTSMQEMVQVWEEQGFCRTKQSDENPFFWWGETGETLLYTHTTPRHWSPTPVHQMAFCVTPTVSPTDPAILRQSAWSFWGAHPRALEAATLEGVAETRPLETIFIGRAQSGVEKRERDPAVWSPIVSHFSLLDTMGAPQAYTPDAYYALLQTARFGICLPSDTPKTHRFVDYMGCGTVPIVVGDAEQMTGYLNPPQEGVHFLRIRGADDLAACVAGIDRETWERLSSACHKWWRENASAEGLFRLTCRRMDQCLPYMHVGLPPWRPDH